MKNTLCKMGLVTGRDLRAQTKTCTNCGQTILFDSVFCSKCGQSNAGQNIVLRDIRKCPSCGTFNAIMDQFCRTKTEISKN